MTIIVIIIVIIITAVVARWMDEYPMIFSMVEEKFFHTLSETRIKQQTIITNSMNHCCVGRCLIVTFDLFHLDISKKTSIHSRRSEKASK